MKKLMLVAALTVSVLLTGCGFGTIQTGNVGVKTTFGNVSQEEVMPGFYVAPLSDIAEYTSKETYVNMQNLTPKAKDKLILKELDVTVYYRMYPNKIADFFSTHSSMSARFEGEAYYRPGYGLIDNIARGVVSDETSKFDSLTLHQNRAALEDAIKASLTEQLNQSDPGYFEVTRVNISTLLTDPSVEESIRKNIQMSNEIDTAMKEVQKRKQEADAMTKTANALTPMLLQHEYIKAIGRCAESERCTLIVGGNAANTMLNIPR